MAMVTTLNKLSVIVLEVPYDRKLVIPAEMLGYLQQCKLYNTKGYGKDKEYIPEIEYTISVEFVESSKFDVIPTEVIEMNSILEENNRLSRENELLQEKLKTSGKSTELTIGE